MLLHATVDRESKYSLESIIGESVFGQRKKQNRHVGRRSAMILSGQLYNVTINIIGSMILNFGLLEVLLLSAANGVNIQGNNNLLKTCLHS